MQTIQVQLPDTVFSALRKAPDEFVQEMRIAAAAKWYELGEVSQGKAAEIAGLSRSDFIIALARYKVSVLQLVAGFPAWVNLSESRY
jgi:predicted HTH domain antitoxin